MPIFPVPDMSESVVLVAWHPPFFGISQVIPGILKSLQGERLGNECPIVGTIVPSPIATPRGFIYRIIETSNFEIHGPWTLVQQFESRLDIFCQRSHLLV